jgi:DNA-nicking Smr family endonuclease
MAARASGGEGDSEPGDEPIEIPIDGALDLHAFAPRDIPSAVVEYLEACRARGILHVRLIHGKGIGLQRQRVAEVLARAEGVLGFRTADESAGGWGATLVELSPADRA